MDTSTEDALFGPWLRRRRKALDLTQKELARLVGCSLHTVRKLESGVRRPSKPVAGAIARATGVPDNEHDAFVRFARAGGADDAQDTRRPDLERPWLVESATEAGPARPDGDVTAPSTATAPARPVERPESDLDDEAPASPPFLARSAELDRLQGALNDALNGHGRVMLIAGEAGQGKTSLMKAFAGRAQAAHPELLTGLGTCSAYTGVGDPFAPFREIFAQLTGHVPSGADRTPFDASRYARLRAFLPRGLASVLDHGPDLLDTLLPLAPLRSRLTEAGIALPDRLTTPDTRATASPFGQRNAAALRSEAVDVLAHVATHAPLLLLLDDLQWADENSLELLLQLARTSPTTRILIIGACRTGEVPPSDGSASPLMQRVIHDLTRQFGDIRVDLDRADTRAFLEAWIDTEPNDLGPGFRDALLRQTGGQPFFTIELLRAMQQRGDLIRDAKGRWVEGPELRWDALPARIAGALGERITRLDPSARKVLTAASIEGETFTVEVVARVLGLDALEVARVSSHALEREHRLVELSDVDRLASGQRVSRYRFRHNLIQRYVLDQAGEPERSYLHEEVAAATEALLGADADPVALAYHYTEAHAPERAAPHLRKAGDRALRTGALTDAIRSYRSALDAWPEADIEGRAELLYDLAQCLSLHGDAPDAERALQSAVAEYERLGDRGSTNAVRAAIMRRILNEPFGGRAFETYRQWLPTLDRGADSRDLVYVLHRMAVLYAHEDDERSLALAERSLGVAERLESERPRAMSLIALGWVLALTRPDRHEDALANLREGIEAAGRVGAFAEVAVGLVRLGHTLQSFGRIDAAEERLEQLMEHCRSHELGSMERQARTLLFRLHWKRGRWAAGQAALPHLRAERDIIARHAFVAMADLDLGRTSEARPWLEELRSISPPDQWLAGRAPALRELLRGAAASGDTRAANRLAADLVDTVGERTSYPAMAIEPVVTAARWLAYHPTDAGRRRLELCVRILERTERQYGSLHARAALAATRGALAEAEGDGTAAAEHYLLAAEHWAEQRYPLDEARARCAAAHLFRRLGSSDEGNEALGRADALLAGLEAQLQDVEMASSFAAVRRRMLSAREEPLL